VNERAKRLDEIFHTASAISSLEERERYLRTACANDAPLRHDIDALLSAVNTGDELFQSFEAGFPGAGSPLDDPTSEHTGSVIGRYKLLEQIGEGGMGIVYMAEQEEPVRRRVALKIIKLGMDTRRVIARFEAERQALAMMDHPNIAKVLDAGTTEPSLGVPPSGGRDRLKPELQTIPQGRPYFVMELVQGVPITSFCDANNLSSEERLALFIPVCQAIQSAHQKGIIHRDLKPSNVLVTLNAGAPHPMVIDFGVAKAIDQKLTEKTLFTNFATMIGTPAYMSPEQAELSGLDIDTRSDIYGLGVLLYELLTGTTPFPEKRLRSVAYAEMQRIITQEEPERPSTRLRKTMSVRSPNPSDFKSAIRDPQSAIDTDLDWIVMKCLEKDRNRRYETAHDLAADIRRHLDSEPVLARPPSAAYRIQKAIRRNKLAFAAAAAILVTLLSGIGVSVWQAVRATQARALAERRLQAALVFADSVSRDVAPELWELIGASSASETLTTNTVALIEQLQTENEPDANLREVLGRLYGRLALILGWPRGNSAWDPQAGLEYARAAIRLLQPREFEKSDDERILALAEAEQVAASTSVHLQATEEALAHYREMDRWATLITNSPSVGEVARTRKFTAQYAPGRVLLRAGRVEEALTNYFMPRLRQLQARGAPAPTAFILDFGLLSQAHQWMGIACLKLGRKEEALYHSREALRFMDEMTRRDPNNSEFAGDQVVQVAQLGEALLAASLPEGLDRLKEALDASISLSSRDTSNVGFLLNRQVVLRYFTQGLTAWASDPAATPSQRRERLDQAKARLEEAERVIAQLRVESARRAVEFEWDPVRRDLSAARARLEGETKP